VNQPVAARGRDLGLGPDRQWMCAGDGGGETEPLKSVAQIVEQAAQLRARLHSRTRGNRSSAQSRLMHLGADVTGERGGQRFQSVLDSLRQRPVPRRVEQHDLLIDADRVPLRAGSPLSPLRLIQCVPLVYGNTHVSTTPPSWKGSGQALRHPTQHESARPA
jgi:hypothetical protein